MAIITLNDYEREVMHLERRDLHPDEVLMKIGFADAEWLADFRKNPRAR